MVNKLFECFPNIPNGLLTGKPIESVVYLLHTKLVTCSQRHKIHNLFVVSFIHKLILFFFAISVINFF